MSLAETDAVQEEENKYRYSYNSDRDEVKPY